MRRLVIIALGAMCFAGAVVRGPGLGVSGPGVSSGSTHSDGAAQPVWEYDADFESTLPSVDRLDACVTINSTEVCPTIRYKGGDCDATDCDAWTYGDALARVAGSGSATYNFGSPLLGATNDDSVLFGGGGADYFQAAASTTGAVTTGDILVVALMYLVDDGSVDYVVNKDVGGTGYSFGHYSDGQPFLILRTGSTASTIAADTNMPNGSWNFVVFGVNRDEASVNGSRAYVNGVLDDTGLDVSARSGSLANAAKISMGATTTGTSGTASGLAYFALYEQADWFAAGAAGPTSWAAFAESEFLAVAGGTPRTGGLTVSARSRASTATIRNYDATSGETNPWTVGNNWVPRVERFLATDNSTVVIGATLNGEAVENLALQSEDFTTTWTEIDAGDTQDTTGNTAPDGTDTADENIADATDGQHGFTQAITLTAVQNTLCVFAKAGDQSWIYLSDDTVANAYSYFDVTSGACALGTMGAAGDKQSVEDYGGGWCRACLQFTGTAAAHTIRAASAAADGDDTFAGDGAAVNTYLWGAQVEAQPYRSSYIATTTTAVTRAAEVYELDLDASQSAGTVVCDVTHGPGNADATTVAGVVLATGTDEIRVRVLPTNDDISVQWKDGGVAQADVGSLGASFAITDGESHALGWTWDANYFNSTTDGTWATADTSGTAPAVQTLILDSAKWSHTVGRCRVWTQQDEGLTP
jgi:hypothetical protein